MATVTKRPELSLLREGTQHNEKANVDFGINGEILHWLKVRVKPQMSYAK